MFSGYVFMKKFVCIVCDKKFDTKNYNQKFCSECKKKWRKFYLHRYYRDITKDENKIKQCAWCGSAWIEGIHEKKDFLFKRYCTKQCGNEARKYLEKERYKTRKYKATHKRSNKKWYKKS